MNFDNNNNRNKDSNDMKIFESIINQMNYYFGDINLSNDYFMKDIAKRNNGCNESHIYYKYKQLFVIIFIQIFDSFLNLFSIFFIIHFEPNIFFLIQTKRL